MNYGMPYQGSKNRIAKQIIDFLPKSEHFYDVFGGGGAVSHCAYLSNKYTKVHYNELDNLVYNGFKRFISNGYKDESRWIPRDEFFKLKDEDFYVASCFSFGNMMKTYAYNEKFEPIKKALHYAILYGDYSYFEDPMIEQILKDVDDRNERHKLIKKYFSYLPKQLESFERLKRLQSGGLMSIRSTNKSYLDLTFKEDSVIYCDPPCIGTEQHKHASFDHNEFYDWVLNNDNIIYISEYRMPSEFAKVHTIHKKCYMATMDNPKNTEENIYIAKNKIDLHIDKWNNRNR